MSYVPIYNHIIIASHKGIALTWYRNAGDAGIHKKVADETRLGMVIIIRYTLQFTICRDPR